MEETVVGLEQRLHQFMERAEARMLILHEAVVRFEQRLDQPA